MRPLKSRRLDISLRMRSSNHVHGVPAVHACSAGVAR